MEVQLCLCSLAYWNGFLFFHCALFRFAGYTLFSFVLRYAQEERWKILRILCDVVDDGRWADWKGFFGSLTGGYSSRSQNQQQERENITSTLSVPLL